MRPDLTPLRQAVGDKPDLAAHRLKKPVLCARTLSRSVRPLAISRTTPPTGLKACFMRPDLNTGRKAVGDRSSQQKTHRDLLVFGSPAQFIFDFCTNDRFTARRDVILHIKTHIRIAATHYISVPGCSHGRISPFGTGRDVTNSS